MSGNFVASAMLHAMNCAVYLYVRIKFWNVSESTMYLKHYNEQSSQREKTKQVNGNPVTSRQFLNDEHAAFLKCLSDSKLEF